MAVYWDVLFVLLLGEATYVFIIYNVIFHLLSLFTCGFGWKFSLFIGD